MIKLRVIRELSVKLWNNYIIFEKQPQIFDALHDINKSFDVHNIMNYGRSDNLNCLFESDDNLLLYGPVNYSTECRHVHSISKNAIAAEIEVLPHCFNRPKVSESELTG